MTLKTPDAEKVTLCCFTLCVLAAAIAVLDNALNTEAPNKLAAETTATQLLIIQGYTTRILNKQDSFSSEKLFITMAMLSTACLLFLSLEPTPSELSIYTKAFSAGCMGIWNTLQMIRWHQTLVTIIEGDYLKWAILALLVYSLGGTLGYIALGMATNKSFSAENIALMINIAALMSTYGNWFRTEGNKKANNIEIYTIRIASLLGSVAVIFGSFNHEKIQQIGAYSKLMANFFSGLWNGAVVLRLFPQVLNEIKTPKPQYVSVLSMFSPPKFMSATLTTPQTDADVDVDADKIQIIC